VGIALAGASLHCGAAAPDPAQVYAWFAGDSGLKLAADNYAVTTWLNGGTQTTNSASTQASRNLVNLTGEPQKVYLRRKGGESAGAVRFGGSDGVWAAKTSFGILSGHRTILVCARLTDGDRQGFLFDSTSTTPGYTRALVVSNAWRVSTSSGIGVPTAAVVTNRWQVHSFLVVTNGPASSVRHYVDGVMVASNTVSQPGALSGLMIGANVAQQHGIRAEVAEVLVYNSALEDAARTSVEAYLTDKWFGVVADPDAPPAPLSAGFVPVFVGGDGGYGCYRIPAMVCSTKGTLLAVADGRISGCGDIPNPLDLVLRRSFDNGRTWGPLQIIANYGSDPSDTDVYPYYGITNPIPRVASGDAALLVDRTNGRIWALYDNGGVTGGKRKIKLEMRYSDDDGTAWSGPLDVEAMNPGLRPAGGEFLAGPGNGVQLEQGVYAGRLIFPVYIYGTTSVSMTIYSDDHGSSWKLGGVAGVGGGEIQVAETPGGGLLASMRDNSFTTTGVRTFNRSTDGGLTWGSVYTSTPGQAALPDPACQGSILRLTTTNDSNRSRMVFANAAHATSRANMTLRLSYDEGQTWPVSEVIHPGFAAYSALAKLSNADIGLLYERANYTRIDFLRRSVQQLSGGADKLPPYTAWSGEHFTPAQLLESAISGPGADPDGDGFTNEAEFVAGTDPLAAESALRLRIANPQTVPLLLGFHAVSNRSYTVQHRGLSGEASWGAYSEVPPRSSDFRVEVPLALTNDGGMFRVVVFNASP
jgi:sialidase-1